MKYNFKNSTIGDACLLVTDGSHFSPKSVEHGEYMVSVKDFTPYGFDFDNCRQISTKDYEKLKKSGCIPQYEDILIGKDGARYFEDIVVYRQTEQPALLSSIAILRCNTNELLPDYLYYMMINPAFKQNVRDNYGSGSAIPRIILKDFKRMPISYPSIKVQQRIISILRGIDEKIELNSKINANLERQGAALVEQYMQSTNDTVALSDIMSFDNGFAFKSTTYLSSGRYRIITIKNVQDGFIDSSGTAFIDNLPSKMKSCCILHIGDVLLSLTGNVGRVGIVCETDLLLNQRVAKFVPAKRELLPFLYFLFRQPCVAANLKSIAKGTAQLNLSPVEALTQKVPYEKESAEACSRVLKNLYQTIISNNQQNITLVKLRNHLLPRLICGEIDVSI